MARTDAEFAALEGERDELKSALREARDELDALRQCEMSDPGDPHDIESTAVCVPCHNEAGAALRQEREALAPFAAAAEAAYRSSDDALLWDAVTARDGEVVTARITVGDVRRARAALSPPKLGEGSCWACHYESDDPPFWAGRHTCGRTDRCHAAQDGECRWSGCPQERDGEPGASGRHCPLDVAAAGDACRLCGEPMSAHPGGAYCPLTGGE